KPVPHLIESRTGADNLVDRALRDAEKRRNREREGSLPRPDLSAVEPHEPAELLGWLERLATWKDCSSDHAWMPLAWEALIVGRPLGRTNPDALRAMLHEAALLAERGDALALHALELPEVSESDRMTEALGKLAAGRKPFGPLGWFG